MAKMFGGMFGAPSFGEALTSIYQNELNRLPDAEGLAHWQNDFNSGQTLEQIAYNISQSPEALAREQAATGAGYSSGNLYYDTPMFAGNEWTADAAAGRGLAQQGLANIAGGTGYDPNAALSATNVMQTVDDWSGYNSRLGTPNQQPVDNQSFVDAAGGLYDWINQSYPTQQTDVSGGSSGGDGGAGAGGQSPTPQPPTQQTSQPPLTSQPPPRTSPQSPQTVSPVRYGFDYTGPPVRYDLDFRGLGDPNIERQRVEDAIFARMNPQLDRSRAALDTRLANQGITQGSAAYREAIDENNRAANDARIAAILSGGQEQSRLFGLGLGQSNFQNQAQNQAFNQALGRGQFYNQGQNQEFSQGLANAQLNNSTSAQAFNQSLAEAQFQNQANQTAINQALLERQIPLNEIIALMSGSQVQPPSFVNTAQTPVQGTDISGNIYANYQGAMNQYNQRVAQQNAMLGGLFGLGGTLGGAYLLR